MKLSILTAALALVLSLAFSLAAEEYERSSISYVNALWLATPEAKKIKRDQVDFLIDAIRAEIQMERFDYNRLPDNLIQDFVDEANRRKKVTMDELAGLMQTRLTPKILTILQGAMPERAGALVGEAQKQTFMATKAKELGITIEEIEKVMNSAYIYMPVLTGYERKETEDRGKYEYKITGGIIWFQISTAGDEPAVNLKVQETTYSKGWGKDNRAFQDAARNFARNLKVATQRIEEFKLHAAITEVMNGRIKFGLGKKEGVKMDNVFWVGEQMMDKSGDVYFEKDGWVRVGKVGDNRSNKLGFSTAWAVKKGSWARGMTLVEHPQLGIDVAFKPMLYTMTIEKGRIPVLGSNLYLEKDYDDPAFGLDLDFHLNIASVVQASQVFLIAGGNGAMQPGLEFSGGNLYTDLSTKTPYIYGWHLGFMKKIYIRQLAFSLAAKAGMRYFTVEQDLTLGLTETEYTFTIKNNAFGFQLDAGFDWASSPDFNFGIMASYRIYPTSESWTLSLDPGEYDIDVIDDEFPDINHSGLAFGLYFHYSPPSLPFDPFSFLNKTVE